MNLDKYIGVDAKVLSEQKLRETFGWGVILPKKNQEVKIVGVANGSSRNTWFKIEFKDPDGANRTMICPKDNLFIPKEDEEGF